MAMSKHGIWKLISAKIDMGIETLYDNIYRALIV